MSVLTYTRQKFPNGFFHPVVWAIVWCITAQLKWIDNQPSEKSQLAASCGSVTVQWLEWVILILFYGLFFRGHHPPTYMCIQMDIHIPMHVCIYVWPKIQEIFQGDFQRCTLSHVALLWLLYIRQWWPLQALARSTSLPSWVASLLSSC